MSLFPPSFDLVNWNFLSFDDLHVGMSTWLTENRQKIKEPHVHFIQDYLDSLGALLEIRKLVMAPANVQKLFHGDLPNEQSTLLNKVGIYDVLRKQVANELLKQYSVNPAFKGKVGFSNKTPLIEFFLDKPFKFQNRELRLHLCIQIQHRQYRKAIVTEIRINSGWGKVSLKDIKDFIDRTDGYNWLYAKKNDGK
ncbi:hypothetical protein [Pseudovibrio sp. Tun.PSC04-5.I4]|uniref:hypothetical protein n=1 Tax=Pseudovibrio sp. Tun.PSC04-5.I4 TaxID=1798213 RepID=UPI0008902C1B|nr:hypothetical protein [Pseudovibrio sp. Tun.PSC04-5.I4]SDR47526.1 hypothetical protein SAMN04515695_5808 [Pseudovibrio sp. Tun.PSC04-5.I4]